MLKNLNFFFLFFALIAEILGTIGGFGSSVFFVPLGNLYFDFHCVLGLTAVFHVSSNLSKILLFKKGLDKKLLINIGIPAVLFVIIGGFLSKNIDKNALEIILGIFLIGLSLIFLLKRDLIVKPNTRNAITGGILSGFSAGLLGTGGAIRGLTMNAFNLNKSTFIATSAFIDFFVDSTRTIVYYKNGYIHKHDLIYIPFLLFIGFFGSYLGKLILSKISKKNFKLISLVMILLIGIGTLYKSINK